MKLFSFPPFIIGLSRKVCRSSLRKGETLKEECEGGGEKRKNTKLKSIGSAPLSPISGSLLVTMGPDVSDYSFNGTRTFMVGE